jgi:hypothetical protein
MGHPIYLVGQQYGVRNGIERENYFATTIGGTLPSIHIYPFFIK